jgi:hypothetical protein
MRRWKRLADCTTFACRIASGGWKGSRFEWHVLKAKGPGNSAVRESLHECLRGCGLPLAPAHPVGA